MDDTTRATGSFEFGELISQIGTPVMGGWFRVTALEVPCSMTKVG
jgi:hypothetical protein